MAGNDRNHERLLEGIYRDYEEMYPKSKAAHARAREILVDGFSHGARTVKPYPFRITAASDAHVIDLDGHTLIDYWQGHYANILGHNPKVVRDMLIAQLEGGYGLQTGILEERQTEFAMTLAKAVGAERVRMCTSGTLVTMYSIMLSRAFTKRRLVVKVAGGWHGANPLALKGVHRTAEGYGEVDSMGVPASTEEDIIVTRFNDLEQLQEIFRTRGDQIACFIFEPCVGGSGFIPATAEYMRAARELTEKHGALLILDEIITGFRFCASGVQKLYKVKPDLSTFGKATGGGMPVSAVVGRADVLDLASEAHKDRVWFQGGTFSAHPLSLTAGKTLMDYLIAHESEVYPALAEKGDRLRTGIEKVFADRGVLARCLGYANNAIPGGSLFSIYFPLREDHYASSTEDVTDPKLCDVILQDQALNAAMLLHGVHLAHSGRAAVSMAHTDEDIERTLEAYDAFARRIVAGR